MYGPGNPGPFLFHRCKATHIPDLIINHFDQLTRSLGGELQLPPFIRCIFRGVLIFLHAQ